ncbi:MAG: hypothetical protein Q9165_000728 [Trypethelium subeluteriae]
MPSPFLLFVQSSPTFVDDDLWTKWYTVEHLPDLVKSKIYDRATLYKEVEVPLDIGRGVTHSRKFLAAYQTAHEEPLGMQAQQGTRTTSEIFAEQGGPKEIGKNGDHDARIYKLIQDYDPDKVGEVPSPCILTVELQPIDEEDYDRFYREEHLDLLHKVPGFRRSQRYVLGQRTKFTQGEPPKFLAIHEFNDLSVLAGPEMTETNSRPWTQKILKENTAFVLRGWQLIKPEGY